MGDEEVGYKRQRCHHGHGCEADVIPHDSQRTENQWIYCERKVCGDAATRCQTADISLIRRERRPRTAGSPTWQMKSVEMPGRWFYGLYLESRHKP